MEDLNALAVGLSATSPPREAEVLKEQQVHEVLARLQRGEPVLGIARALGRDPKTVRAWRARGGWRARRATRRPSIIDRFADWLRARAPEVAYNCAVLLRELRPRGYGGSLAQLHRVVRPWREAAQHARQATVRFETAPGQAQVDFGQRRLWIGEQYLAAHVFVCTLGYSRRLYGNRLPA